MSQDYPYDPYEVLQVSPNAEPEVVEAAYRRLARKYHPDVNSSPDATKRMQIINWAYEILRDPDARREYDKFRADEHRNGQEYSSFASDERWESASLHVRHVSTTKPPGDLETLVIPSIVGVVVFLGLGFLLIRACVSLPDFLGPTGGGPDVRISTSTPVYVEYHGSSVEGEWYQINALYFAKHEVQPLVSAALHRSDVEIPRGSFLFFPYDLDPPVAYYCEKKTNTLDICVQVERPPGWR